MMKVIIKSITFMIISFLMAGCVSTPEKYSDPLASFGNHEIPKHFSELALGVVLSESFYNSSRYLEDQQAVARTWAVNEIYAKDVDAKYIIDAFNSQLVKRFKKVVPLRNIDDARSSEIDLYVMLDMNVSIGSVSGTTTTVLLSGIFMSLDDRMVEKVDGTGSAKVPFPAFKANVRQAASRSVVSFSESLDRCAKLKRFAADFSGLTYGMRTVELPAPDFAPVNVAVADIFVEGLSSSAVKTLTDQLRSTLVETQYFTVLSRDDMQKILDEHNFQFSEAGREVEQLVQLGRILPAQKIIGGTIGKIGDTYSLTLRLVDIETGTIEYMAGGIIKAKEDELVPLIRHSAKVLSKKYSLGTSTR